MKKSILSLITTALLIPATSQAAVVLDTSHYPQLEIGFFGERAQTFTVSNTGTLSSIHLYLSTQGVTPTVDLEFDVRTTVGGVPTEADTGPNILANLSIPALNITSRATVHGIPLVAVDLTPYNISVTAGDVLAFRVNDPTNNTVAIGASTQPGALTNGESEYGREPAGTPPWTPFVLPSNLIFETYVTTVPEPSSSTLLAMSIGFACCHRSRRNQ
ncbi:hypothetical protein HW115_07345 [Verrucomicrobiaceae bacterium N1E253]|uniref:PEP-CTERM protein-sorting domain-containing protein n=1 Tax=Oceaniferula marina TaxID=2748318 RepID=A0A851GHS9_9BACT|nr:hypothetical protein [Oceaniferula marina]NWK55421.1 hypothetical protein [Oceaniferula marina]